MFQNLFLLLILAYVLIAIWRGRLTGHPLKHLWAALNWSVVTLLLWGAWQYAQYQWTQRISDEETQARLALARLAADPDRLNNTRPDTARYSATLNQVYVFLDFSGSVKAKDLYEQIGQLRQLLSQSRKQHFYGFGSCTKELPGVETLTIQAIEELKNSVCVNGQSLKRNTDMVGAVRYAAELLAQSADDKTLCLFLTDDIQSPVRTDMAVQAAELQPIMERFRKAGVLFDLIRLPGSRSNQFISTYLKQSVHVNSVLTGNDLSRFITQAIRQRLMGADLRVARSEMEGAMHNSKVEFNSSPLPGTNEKETVWRLTARSTYQTLPVVLRVDSILTNNWVGNAATPVASAPYLWLNPNIETAITLPLHTVTSKSIAWLNTSETQPARLHYRLVYPGSNQISSASLFDTTNATYRPLAEAPFNGQISSQHYARLSLTLHHAMPWWVYGIYALVVLIMARLIRVQIRPRAEGIRLAITEQATGQLTEVRLKADKPFVFNDAYNDPVFQVRPRRVRTRRFGLWQQPNDLIEVLQGGVRTGQKGTLLHPRRAVDLGDYRVEVR